jgi:hypothetical protein
MPDKKQLNLRGILVLAGVAVLTAAVGFVTTVQLSARADAVAGPDSEESPAGPSGWAASRCAASTSPTPSATR